MNTRTYKKYITGSSTLTEAAVPPSSKVLASRVSNNLVIPPRQVIRGESLYTPHTNNPKQVALTDWLNIVFPFDSNFCLVEEFVEMFRCHFGDSFGGLRDRGCGKLGYQHSFEFENGKTIFAYGGSSQRGTAILTISGTGCALIDNWNAVVSFIEILGGYITRWDGAVDDFEGKHSVDIALDWFLKGKFSTGGNKPMMKQHGNWAEPDGTGRTIEIGNRKNGKMLRIYEKGKQLHDPESPWVRWEVEFKRKDRHIPIEVLLNQRPYIAGAYSCLDWVSEEAIRIRTNKKVEEISYAHKTYWAKNSYGKHIAEMLDKEGSAEAVINKLVVVGKNRNRPTPKLQEFK